MGQESDYPRYDGVLMKPGVRVVNQNRDSMNWDQYGTIVAVRKFGSNWEFDVDFAEGGLETLSWNEVWPEDTDTEEARAWRLARQLKVFLCHASEDKAAARSLYQRLKQAGMNPWLDEEDIKPGQDWDAAIRQAVRDCNIVLVLISANSVGKTGYVQKEIRFALDRADEKPEGTTYIIPVKLEDYPVPQSLRKWQWVNLYAKGGYDRLIEALQAYANELT